MPDASGAPVEQLTSFDYRRAQLEKTSAGWQLRAGDVWLKNFGNHEKEARTALGLVRELKLTEHGTVGSPLPAMEYWLSEGRAPRPLNGVIGTTAIDPDLLRVQQTRGQWCLENSRQLLFNFGAHEEDARRALDTIKHYRFNQISYIGQPVPLMMCFFADEHVGRASSAPTNGPMASRARGPTSQRSAGRSLEDQHAQFSNALANSLPADIPSVGRQLAVPGSILPGGPQSGERVLFDWRQVEVRNDNQNWKLQATGHTLAEFGPNQQDARQAHAAARFYRFTEQCRLPGSARPVIYYLANGQAPRGVRFGTESTPFHPEALTVQHVGKEFVISEGQQVLFAFGEREEDARQALQTIQHFKFDHFCRIGNPMTGGLTFFTRAR
jgi:hypothetical protein